jgi:hypothetical protein
VLAALGLAAAAHVWRGVKRGLRKDALFFADLVNQLSPILEAKGFRLTRNVHMAKSFGHRIATFEGPSFIVDAAWDARDRDILLLHRPLDQSTISAGDRLAEAHIPQGASGDLYARATGVIVAAARSLGRSLTSA